MQTVEQALEQILAGVRPMATERVSLLAAFGRALAEPVIATRTLPPADNSSMDGYAVRAADLAKATRIHPVELPVVAHIGAGHVAGHDLEAGQAARIMTGASVPPGADAIVKREDTDESDKANVKFFAPVEPGAWIRRRGEDVVEGEPVLGLLDTMGAGEIGLCAALGRSVVTVRRRPTVAILSTGDELAELDEVPGPGQIVNSNAWALAAQVVAAGGVPSILGSVKDDREAITARVRDGLEADCLVTSGGVSVGDFDHVRGALEQAGVKLAFWKVAMKPGKPVTFGRSAAGKPVFGLPGNPASSMVSFELFVRPALRAMLGDPRPARPRVRVMLEDTYEKAEGRRHYLRAQVRREDDRLIARLLGRQGSGQLTSMVRSNALVEVPEASTRVVPGEALSAIMLGPI